MPAESDFMVGFGFLALLALAVLANLFFQRLARKENVKDSEIILAELRFALDGASQPCRFGEIAKNPGGFSGRAQGFGIGPVSYYKLVRFEVHGMGAAPPPLPPLGDSGDEFMGWCCDREAAAAGLAHFDRDDEQAMERLFLVMQSGEGVCEAVYSRAFGSGQAGGGIMRASFNGKHLGMVNFSSSGAVSDAGSRRIGKAKWEGTSMVVNLHGTEHRLSGPVFIDSSFRLLGRDADVSSLSRDDRMLLVCLSVFNQTYWRARRVAKGL